MSKEKLQCQLCSKIWSRKKSRGRKPRFCASCLEANMVEIHKIRDYIDEVDDSEEIEDINSIVDDTPKQKLDPKNKINWVCPTCKSTATTYVALSCPPICNNPAFHSSKHIEMIVNSRQKEEKLAYA